jgi:hypothetical protein
MRSCYVLILSLLCASPVFAQTGPGGVGNASGSGGQPSLRIYVRAHSGTSTTTDGAEVSSWNDQSGNANNLSSPVANRPTYQAAVFNGWPVLRFDGNDYADAASALGIAASGGFHYFIVFDYNSAPATGTSGGGDGAYMIDRTTASNGLASLKVLTGSVLSFQKRTDAGASLGVVSTTTSVTTATRYLVDYVRQRGTSYRISLNGTQEGTLADGDGDITPPVIRVGRHATAASGGINGDIAEVFAYGTSLNAAQQRIVQNYLAAKYGVSISSDIYSYESVHYFDVAGIGRASAGASHISATSGNFNINVASIGTDGHYLMFGHDNADVTTLTTIGGDNFNGDATNTRRIAREWRIDKSGGDLGDVSVSIDSTLFTTGRPSTQYQWALFVDTDGDGNFSTGSPLHYDLTISGTSLTASNVPLPDGAFVTVGALRRTLSFASATASGFENTVTYPTLTASLNYAYSAATSVTFDYTVAVGTAQLADFSNTRTSATITSGNLSVDLNAGATAGDHALSIVDDALVEGTQTVVVSITGASITNAIAGTITALTYSILDDDEPRKIAFQSASVSQAEGTGANYDLTINFSLTSTDAGVTATDVNTSIDITATGTATLGDISVSANDARLFNDVAAGAGEARQSRSSETTAQVTFNTITGLSGVPTILGVVLLSIRADSDWDPDETVILTLANPQNGALNTSNTVLTLTLTNDDTTPTVALSSAALGVSEGAGSGSLTVSLSAAAGSDVTVTFSSAGGSPAATSGADYSVSTLSPLTITAGNTSTTINFTIAEDAAEEADETFVVTLTGTNASLGAITASTVTILDNDGFGSTGPAGLGSSTTNRLWLRADAGTSTTTDGADVNSWQDQSGNANNATATAGNRASYETNEINGYPALRFSGNDFYDPGSSLSISGAGGYHYYAVVRGSGTFTTGTNADGNGWYVIDRTPGGNPLSGLKINAGGVFGFQKRTDAGSGLGGVNSTTALSTTLFRIVSYARNRGSTYRIYVNSVQEGSLADSDGNTTPDIPRIGRHNSNATNGGIVGDIGEIIVFNSHLNDARRLILDNHLSAKYAVTITNDYYAGNAATHIRDVQGIGTTDGTSANTHRRSENSAGLLLQELNGSLDGTNEFLLAGHSLATFSASDTDLPPGLDSRWDRDWYFDKTGTIDARIGFDMSVGGSGAVPAVASNYRLLYRAGTSGTYSTVTTAAVSIENTDQVVFNVLNANLIDGYYTIGSTDESTSPLPVVMGEVSLKQVQFDAVLTWNTLTEQNSFGFRIERRLKAAESFTAWTQSGFVEGAGNSLEVNRYSFRDSTLQGTGAYEYRIVQIDFNSAEQLYGPYSLSYSGPNQFALMPAYPNPFNSRITVPFALPERAFVLLEVYDLNGRRVSTLVNRTMEAGFHRVAFVSDFMASGVYIVRLRSDGRTAIKKITHLK